MKKYLGILIGSLLFELAKFTANSACIGLFFQPEEDCQIKILSQLDD
ncbi:MAG: cyclic lactone autoinducer peptide [Tissierellia bacterium]|jgi:cyclic lactone autoinducer peptide|nr:cyclic lactone autoinducer peptide [Tissierellia bacterium]